MYLRLSIILTSFYCWRICLRNSKALVHSLDRFKFSSMSILLSVMNFLHWLSNHLITQRIDIALNNCTHIIRRYLLVLNLSDWFRHSLMGCIWIYHELILLKITEMTRYVWVEFNAFIEILFEVSSFLICFLNVLMTAKYNLWWVNVTIWKKWKCIIYKKTILSMGRYLIWYINTLR
jgi:hypothetical protein